MKILSLFDGISCARVACEKAGIKKVSFREKLKSKTIRSSGMASGINDRHNWDSIRIGQIGKGGQGDRIYSPDGKSVNLSANGGGGVGLRLVFMQ